MDEPTVGEQETISFGDALAELEGIVGSLESGALDLEESMGRYERGVALLQDLQARLRDAEQRVRMLVGELEGEEGDVGQASGP